MFLVFTACCGLGIALPSSVPPPKLPNQVLLNLSPVSPPPYCSWDGLEKLEALGETTGWDQKWKQQLDKITNSNSINNKSCKTKKVFTWKVKQYWSILCSTMRESPTPAPHKWHEMVSNNIMSWPCYHKTLILSWLKLGHCCVSIVSNIDWCSNYREAGHPLCSILMTPISSYCFQQKCFSRSGTVSRLPRVNTCSEITGLADDLLCCNSFVCLATYTSTQRKEDNHRNEQGSLPSFPNPNI